MTLPPDSPTVSEREVVSVPDEAHYREMLVASPLPTWVYELETQQFLAVNPAAVRLYGYSPEEFLGSLTLADLAAEGALGDVVPPEEGTPRTGPSNGRLLWRHRRKDGTPVDVEITSRDLMDDDGRPARLVMAYDVSERTAAEEALQIRERHLAGLVATQRELLRADPVRKSVPHLLEILGRSVDAARACYYDVGQDPGPQGELYADLSEEWLAPGVDSLRAQAATSARVYPGKYAFFHAWIGQLRRGEIVTLTDRPDLGAPERHYLEARGMRSILFAPLLVRGVVTAVLSFHYQREPHVLLRGEHNPLLAAAAALAQALERERATDGLAAETGRLAATLATLSERDRYLNALVAAQRELLNEPDVADVALESFLGRLGQASGADRVYFFDRLHDEESGETYLRQRGEWCAPGLPKGLGGPAFQRLPLRLLKPGWQAELEAGQMILGAVGDHTPPVERALLEVRQVRSGLLLPVLVRGKFSGGLGFDDCRTPRPRWNEAEVNHLRAAASALALALEREQSAHALAAQTQRLGVTLSALAEGVITTDADGRIVLLNRAAETLTGYPSDASVGRPLREVFRTFAEAEGGEPRIAPGSEGEPESLPLSEGRDRIWLEASGTNRRRLIDKVAIPLRDAAGRLAGVVRVFRDVTDEERLAAEMLRASKLESLGILAGGIAHDFNNILTAILGNVSLARTACAGTRTDLKLEEAERACLQARTLTGQLLTFARGGAPVRKLARLPEIVRESIGFALHGSRLRVIYGFPIGLWPVEADSGQLSQVLNNLAINAMQAMGTNGGNLEVGAENLVLAAGDLPALPAGRYVKISVADSGCGIEAQHLDKIFDPFFSTKPGGSGLGLTTSYSIVKRHGGHMGVDSVPGAGSTFHLFLPAAEERGAVAAAHGLRPPANRPRVEAPAPLKPEAPPASPSGGLRVLVLDDEPAVRSLLEDMLAHLGAAEIVVTASGAATIAAYRQARAEGRPFDLLILDLTVPGGIGGREVLATLRPEEENVYAIASSGYADDPTLSRYSEHGFAGILSKPYRLSELAALLAAVPRG